MLASVADPVTFREPQYQVNLTCSRLECKNLASPLPLYVNIAVAEQSPDLLYVPEYAAVNLPPWLNIIRVDPKSACEPAPAFGEKFCGALQPASAATATTVQDCRKRSRVFMGKSPL